MQKKKKTESEYYCFEFVSVYLKLNFKLKLNFMVCKKSNLKSETEFHAYIVYTVRMYV